MTTLAQIIERLQDPSYYQYPVPKALEVIRAQQADIVRLRHDMAFLRVSMQESDRRAVIDKCLAATATDREMSSI